MKRFEIVGNKKTQASAIISSAETHTVLGLPPDHNRVPHTQGQLVSLYGKVIGSDLIMSHLSIFIDRLHCMATERSLVIQCGHPPLSIGAADRGKQSELQSVSGRWVGSVQKTTVRKLCPTITLSY